MVRPTPSPNNRRGSPEAVEKRRLARKLNRLLTEGSDPTAQDGRTARRRQRLLQELEEGTRATPPTLKPIEVLQRANDLLTLGESMASLRKVIRIPARPPVDLTEAAELLSSLQRAYEFRPEVFEFLGLPAEALAQVPPTKPRRGRPRRS